MDKQSEEHKIEDVAQIIDLWKKTYNAEGKTDWSHIIPYYADDIEFRDSIQCLHGIEDFKAMTERLSARSNELKMEIVDAVKEGSLIFIE